jgi:drug/metabolite transporter (DMT)-like permease
LSRQGLAGTAAPRIRSSAPIFLVAGTIAAMVAAQVFYKLAGLWSRDHAGLIAAFVLNPWLWIGLACAVVGMVLWLLALRHLPLSVAYPWTALVYIFTPIASALIFGDLLRTEYLIGLGLIAVGVVITTRSVSTS